MINNDFQGIWPAMFTPVNEEGDPSYEELERLVEQLIKEGVDGLYILGSTGQGILFPEHHRKKVAEVVINIAKEKVPVMVHVGSLKTSEAIILACHAAETRADAVSSVNSIYYPGNADMVLEHYRCIAKATNLPFFPYQLGNKSIKGDVVEFISQLVEIPQVKGMKLTTTDLMEISTIHNFAKDRLKLFSGADELLCHSALCGTVGAIGSFYNIWYKECAHVRTAFLNGDFELAQRFMLEFQKIIVEILPNAWTFFRAAMQIKYDIDIGSAIAPLGNRHEEWSSSEVEHILERLESTINVQY